MRVLAILLYFHLTISIGAVEEDVFPMGKWLRNLRSGVIFFYFFISLALDIKGL